MEKDLDLQAYWPINTVEKVDALLVEVLNSGRRLDSHLELAILVEIRKIKIQLYFKQRFAEIEIQPVMQTKAMFLTDYKLTDLKDLATLKYDFKGKTISWIAKEIGRPERQIIRFFDSKGIEASGSTVFDEHLANCFKAYAKNIVELNERKEKLDEQNTRIIRVGAEIIREKFKPSYGAEGNYVKLIYTRPKS